MCGRYTLYRSKHLAARYHLADPSAAELLADINDRYNIAPSQDAPVITQADGQPHLQLMRWGYLPPWAKDPKDIFKYKTFNARAEGIFHKPMWKTAARLHRALIPSTGFYEWQQQTDGKHPFLIVPTAGQLPDDIFSFAGLYGTWHDAQGDEQQTYSIITTAANSDMQQIHDRMPVILSCDEESLWLDPAIDDQELLSQLLHPYPDGQLAIHEVSRDVNSSHSDLAHFIEPLNSK